jgi:hypothetical protein
MTFDELDREAADTPNSGREGSIGYGVNYVIAHAADNANDEAGRIASIECMLCFPSEIITAEVQQWFVERGIRY